MNRHAFTLIELMIVIGTIAFLAAISIPTFSKFIAKAKRTEAHMNLHALYAAQKAYWAEHGKYSTQLSGPESVGWKPEGYHGGGETENFAYTYGFSGTEGQNYFTGKLKTAASYLSGAKADDKGFVAYAVGDIDADGKPDIITIDETNNIKIIQDDLAD